MKNSPSHIVPVRRITEKTDLSVIILAANSGRRMRSYGPKSLLNINEKETLIEYQVNAIKIAFPKAEIILVIGFSADKLIKKCPDNVRIVENQLYEHTNEVEQVRLALNNILNKNIIIIKDDIIFDHNMLLQLDRDYSCIVYDSYGNIDEDNIGVSVVDDFVNVFSYDKKDKWCHIVHLVEKDMLKLKSICAMRERSKLYLFEILNMLLDKSIKIKAIKIQNNRILKIDVIKDLERINTI